MFRIGGGATAWIGLTVAARPIAGQDVPRPAPGELRLAACELEGVAPPLRCGTFTVAENRDDPGGRTIDLYVVLLEATGPIPSRTRTCTWSAARERMPRPPPAA